MEEWKDIKIWPNYEVSNHGRVRNKLSQHIQGAAPRKEDGYVYANYSYKGKGKIKSIHRLVAIEFISNPENKRTINHIDGDKSNNHVNNLEWHTYKENIQHSLKEGLRRLMYTDEEVLMMRELKLKMTYKEVATHMNLKDTASFRDAIRGKRYMHV